MRAAATTTAISRERMRCHLLRRRPDDPRSPCAARRAGGQTVTSSEEALMADRPEGARGRSGWGTGLRPLGSRRPAAEAAEKNQARIEAEIAKSEARLRSQLDEIVRRLDAGAGGPAEATSSSSLDDRLTGIEASLAGRVASLDALTREVVELKKTVDALVARPAPEAPAPPPPPEPVDLGPVIERLAALVARPMPEHPAAPLAAPEPVDLGPVMERLDVLVPAEPVDLAPVLERLDALAARPEPEAPAPAAPPEPVDLTPVQETLDAVRKSVEVIAAKQA